MKNPFNLKEVEKKIIQNVFIECPFHSNADKAKILGISERTLYRKIKEYKINPKFHKTIQKAIDIIQRGRK